MCDARAFVGVVCVCVTAVSFPLAYVFVCVGGARACVYCVCIVHVSVCMLACLPVCVRACVCMCARARVRPCV